MELRRFEKLGDQMSEGPTGNWVWHDDVASMIERGRDCELLLRAIMTSKASRSPKRIPKYIRRYWASFAHRMYIGSKWFGVHLDVTGLPILTPEIRSALKSALGESNSATLTPPEKGSSQCSPPSSS